MDWTGDNWSKWPDWARLLVAWRCMNHTGLSLHAIATLTPGRPPDLYRELKECRYTDIDFCHNTGAPIWRVRSYKACACVQHPSIPEDKWKQHVEACHKHRIELRSEWSNAFMLSRTLELLNEWPWPKYKGLRLSAIDPTLGTRHVEGVLGKTGLTDEYDVETVRILKRCARGEMNPFDAKLVPKQK